MKVLDAGCGGGRNSNYLMQAGINVYGVDASAEAIEAITQVAQQVAPQLPASQFILADLAALPFADASFDAVICSAVLHFAHHEAHFRSMATELWRVLKPGGMLFCRLSTTIGMADTLPQVSVGLYQMPHGAVWFLADEALLLQLEYEFGAARLDPLKSTLVEHQRSMTTWVLQKIKP